MFIEQKKKKNYRTFIYAAIIVVLCLLIIVIAWPVETTATEETEISQNQGLPGNTQKKEIPDVSETLQVPDDDELVDSDDFDAETYDNEEEQGKEQEQEIKDITQTTSSYYLVKRADDLIKVFFVDNEGKQIELETTDIVYDVLGVEDQKLFDQGFVIKSQEELAGLLQDFES